MAAEGKNRFRRIVRSFFRTLGVSHDTDKSCHSAAEIAANIGESAEAAAPSLDDWKNAALASEALATTNPDGCPSATLSDEHAWINRRREVLRNAGAALESGDVEQAQDGRIISEAGGERSVSGLALSGGGIRSATFSLGVLRALGAEKLIYNFDYLSTVSGGSYIGGFYGGLFAERAKAGPLIGSPTCADPFVEAKNAIRQLRQFGRYLAPNGSGDLLRGAAVVLRNVVAIHLVLGTLIMLLAMAAIFARYAAFPWLGSEIGWFGRLMGCLPFVWAPLLVMLAIPLLVFFSMGFAFWLAPRGNIPQPGREILAGLRSAATVPVLGATGLSAAALYFAVLSKGEDQVADIIATISAIAVFTRIVMSFDSSRKSDEYWDRVRTWLTGAVAYCGLGGLILCTATALTDVMGYALWRWLVKPPWIIGTVPSVAIPGLVTTVLIPAANALFKSLNSKPGGSLVTLSGATKQNILLSAVAFLLIASMLMVWVALAYLAVLGKPQFLPLPGHEAIDWRRWQYWFAGLLLTGICVGYTPSFINLSSLSSLYAARLRRAYLGAGNSDRIDGKIAVDREDESDDIQLQKYYAKATASPLHLINVTINETSSEGSHVVQRDRHGRNLVLSPLGILYSGDHEDLCEIKWDEADHERLPLSTWIGISGAAFSTGLGARTNLRLALIAGLSNVRLGYWWRRQGSKLTPFATQYHLVRELTADFPGIRAPRFYLSDGGHFENTAAYELIRRKVPYIVICDNGQDEHYQYEDVANLVRKARIDFDCEINFLRSYELDECLQAGSALRKTFGTLGQIAGEEPAAPTAVAAIAQIKYAAPKIEGKESAMGTLILIKPRLTGDGPQDLINYKAANIAFPQQPTLDQFFDEDQWESYYHLGFLIGSAVFKENGEGWSPRAMIPLPPAPSANALANPAPPSD